MKYYFIAIITAGLAALSVSLAFTPLAMSQEGSFDWKSDWAAAEGFALDIDTEGYHFPTAIAFVPNPGPGPKDPLYFVTELRGTLKVITNDRTVQVFAEDFAPKFTPKEELPSGYGQGGLVGLCLDPAHGYVFVTFLYQDENQILRNGLVRFQAEPGAFSLQPTEQFDILEPFLPYEAGLAHAIGPCQVQDDTIYVSVGESWQPRQTQNLDAMHGKIIRMTLDGKPAPDNPFYEDDDVAKARNYVWAYGFRNPFGLKLVSDRLFAADNGPNVDRFVEVYEAQNYLYDGSDNSIATNSDYVIVPALGPVQMDYYPEASELFPEDYRNLFYLALSGNFARDKMPGIMTFEYGFEDNRLLSVPKNFLKYRGKQDQMVTGLAFGPDGLYFAPIYPNESGQSYVAKISYDPERGSTMPIIATSDPFELMQEKSCIGCHSLKNIGGYGGTAGPDLTPNALVKRLDERLNSEGYEQSLQEIDQVDHEPQSLYRAARQEVLAAHGQDRVRLWIKYRIQEPRFDNLYSQMPNLGVTDQEAEIMANYLTEVKPESRLRNVLNTLIPPPITYTRLALFTLAGFIAGAITLVLVWFVVSRFKRNSRPAKRPVEGEQVVGASR